jgi:hypothetical protein
MHDSIIKGVLDSDEATAWYLYLKENIEWEEGVKTRFGVKTRLAYSVRENEYPEIIQLIQKVLNKVCTIKSKISIYGVYLNYYLNGTMYTPNHSHAGTVQLVISLGATRTFVLGSKESKIENGDVAIFGSTIHGVKKDSVIKDGRISIACFIGL